MLRGVLWIVMVGRCLGDGYFVFVFCREHCEGC